jgi:hypothetical protein
VLVGTALFLQVAVAAVRLRRISLWKIRLYHGRRDSILVMVVTSPAPLLIPAHTDNGA